MDRINFTPRENYQEICNGEGFTFHTPEHKYWLEDKAYKFTQSEIDKIKNATTDLYRMCLKVVNHVVNNPDLLYKLKIPKSAHKFVIDSWNNRDVELYSRFDLMIGENGEIKMAEINAQTPQSILEAGRVQKTWATNHNLRQYNEISPLFYDAFKDLGINDLHFSCLKDEVEDREGVQFIQDCCPLFNKFTFIQDIGWDGRNFLDLNNKIMKNIFLLYPFEWLVDEEFFQFINSNNFKPINPWWTYILTSKGVLPLLWELFPDNEYLLPAYWEKPNEGTWVSKSLYGREGCNIEILNGDITISSTIDNNYSNVFGVIYQKFMPIKKYEGKTPIIGSWVIDSEPAGIGIREDDKRITTIGGRFVPHFIEG